VGLPVFKSLGIGAVALTLAACGALKPHQAGPPPPVEPPRFGEQQIPGKAYHVDGTQSELRVLVRRAGPLARLGHNHVMVNRALRGAVIVADAPDGSAFWLDAPAAGFTVDDAAARADEGPDFAAEVPDDAKSGTLQNMLGAAVLDAAEFPQIEVKSVAVLSPSGADAPGALRATVAISIAGHESRIDVPFNLQSDADQLSASGTVDLRQTDLGLTPYSLMLGALQVQDAITVKFKIVALPGREPV
jgi:hypothetical protein